MLQIIFDMEGTLLTTHTGTVSFLPEIPLLLETLSHKHKLYLWTARGRASTIEILKKLNWLKYFTDIKTSSDGPAKPNVELLKEILDLEDKIILIGDSFQDMLGAKKLGAFAIAASWYYDVSVEMKDFGADVICTNLNDLIKIIDERK
jgi:phosphoglycolate phosphatase-like HAD superfamily hydrolase